MKIHGTAKGAALSTKDFGVAFGGGNGVACSNFEDSLGTDANGTNIDGTTIDANGKFDNCLSFDPDNCVEIDGIASNDAFSTNVGAISFWVKVNSPSVTDRTHICFGDTDANTYLKVTNDGTLIQFSLRNAGTIQWEGRKAGGLPNNTWVSIIINKPADEDVVVYINNVSVDDWDKDTDLSAWVTSAMNNFRIGCRNYNNASDVNTSFFEGFIDDFVVFDTALTSDQRVFLQTNPASSLANCDGIKAYYNCNQFDNSTLTNNAVPIE